MPLNFPKILLIKLSDMKIIYIFQLIRLVALKKLAKQIFKAYSRENNKIAGLLGLAISSKMASLLKGQISYIRRINIYSKSDNTS